MKSKGFTLIEMMIVIAILGILAAIIVPGVHNAGVGLSDGTTCVGGYKVNLRNGNQIIGSNGGGVPCSEGVVAQ